MSLLHTPVPLFLPLLCLKEVLPDQAPGRPIFNGASHSGYTYTSTPLKMSGIRSAWLSALCLAALTCAASGQDVQGATGAINSTTLSVEEGEITVHTIEVSNETHYFTPNSINALPGDIVTFKFWPGDHSVIRAAYGYPCIPYEDVDENGEGGFYSGVMSPDAQDVRDDNVSEPPHVLCIWTLTRKTAPDLEPDHQFYCANVLLLWCTWKLRRLGDVGRDQCGREPNYRNADQTRSGKTTSKSFALIKAG